MKLDTHNPLYPFLVVLMLMLPVALTGCIEDGVTTDAADQPEFSVSTLDMGTLFTLTPSATRSFVVYNRHDKILNISRISLGSGDGSFFRLNVDGEAARSFSNIEIRPNDSIYIFVETTVPSGGRTDYLPFDVSDRIDFLTNGSTRSVALTARGQDVEDVRDVTLSADTRWDSHPRRVYGTLTVPEGITLTIGPGVAVYFHDRAALEVAGTLVVDGAPDTDDAPGMVTMRGDRLDAVVGSSSFDLLASQWGGIRFLPTSTASRISHADIRGMTSGISIGGDGTSSPDLTILNSRLHRSGATLLSASGAALTLTGCELSDSKGALISISGGSASAVQCSMVNYYISSFDVGPLVEIDPDVPTVATFDNCLLKNYRNSLYVSPSDLAGTDVRFRSSMLAAPGSDDDNFTGCLWDADIITNVDAEEHVYDYTLRASSAGIDSGDPSLLTPAAMTDMYGTPRHTPSPTIGAYEIR